MAAEYGRAKAGEPTRTGMSRAKLKEWVLADNRKKARKEGIRRMMGG
jgi:hypothetical protein